MARTARMDDTSWSISSGKSHASMDVNGLGESSLNSGATTATAMRPNQKNKIKKVRAASAIDNAPPCDASRRNRGA